MPRKCTGQPNGRPVKQIAVTPEQLITAMAEAQCPKTEVASRLGISTDTFDKRDGFAALYTAGRLSGKSKLRQKMISMAMSGNAQVMIFLGKAALGMKETSSLELSGPDGGPIESTTNDARSRLASLLARSASTGGAADVPVQPDGQ